MKNFRFKLAALAFTATLMASSVSSCSVGDNGISYDDIRPKAIVTVKTLESGETYFQVDEKTTLLPVDWKNPYKGETRALLNYDELSEANNGPFTKSVKVNWIDSVLTKKAVPYTDEFKKGADDAISLIGDWVTVCEDGYLTLHFAAWWGTENRKPHILNLGIDPESRSLYLRHDVNGDNNGHCVPAEGVVSFKIDELLPDVKDGDELTLHWTEINNEKKKATLKYSGRFELAGK